MKNTRLDMRLAPATRDFLVPAILSPEGKAAGYALELVAGSKARLRQIAQGTLLGEAFIREHGTDALYDAEAADFFDVDDDGDHFDVHFDDYGQEM